MGRYRFSVDRNINGLVKHVINCKNIKKLRFDCPIVANDTTQYLGRYEIALVGYDGKIKIAKLTPELELIVT